MKTALLLSLLILLGNYAYAQDSTTSYVQRFYLELGAGLFFNSDLPSSSTFALSLETRNKWVFGVRSQAMEYNDPAYGGEPNMLSPYLPTYELEDLTFTVGKVKNLSKKFALYFSTGPTYVRYKEPINIKENRSGWGGIITSTTYTYDTKTSHHLGWGARGGMAFLPWRLVGFQVGSFFNYNSKVPYGGVDLNVMVGRLGPKTEKKP